MGKNSQSDENLKRELLDTVIRTVDELERISAKLDRNEAMLKIVMESLPQIPVTPVLVTELKYDHKNKTLWADERYHINFEGKQAELLAQLFTKAGIPKKTHLLIDTLVEESYDHATDKYSQPRTFYLRAKEVQKKLDEGFRTKDLLTVTLKKIHFNHT